MRNTTRAALGAAPLSLALLLAACGGDDDPADRSTTTTTTEATTSSSAAETRTETPPPASGEATAPPEPASTAPPSQAGDPLPETGAATAAELVRAWGAGDRDRAAELATPETVDQLFGHADPGGDDWELLWCDSSVSQLYCTFTSATRSESLVTQEGRDGIARVTFGSATDDVPAELAEAADALVRAWGAGDREAAARYTGEPDLATLFGLADPGGPSWELDRCTTVDDDPQCVYRSPDHDQTVILHLSDTAPRPVSYVFVYVPA